LSDWALAIEGRWMPGSLTLGDATRSLTGQARVVRGCWMPGPLQLTSAKNVMDNRYFRTWVCIVYPSAG
jgi:hypothetical protein